MTDNNNNNNNSNDKIMYILRGLPGSGKSTLAKSIIKENNGKGIILSTDNYFIVNGKDQYDPTKIGEAHQSNQNKCKEKCEQGISPIIIDNTNIKRWEAKPYVEIALEYNYKIEIREPDTPWFKERNAKRLAKKSIHNVTIKKITGMISKWDEDFSIESILKEKPPNRNHYNNNSITNKFNKKKLNK
ncbi:P-loop containing nucleoside triphosphate hydrolase protein [Anaeromyces robustus]|uniref:p-loop containing nucleoside triphosphate hydrolase protein n=1 Tax=Anaeromyces robustus TaxID=1754192 RepID=A0A1Y1XFG3_9FUNG|nr:P-loop containing nucleoside triphosphate hydrolase protein [Anaeromyces robustus]|eukprot:ORX84156.1 P-loop containing nucleoside triphosphate hydrolase protein [Anaeromyces robustus]